MKMKAFALALACLLALSGASAADNCYNDVSLDCGQASNSLVLPSCNAIYGGYGHHGSLASEMQAYANLHLERSFEYLLSAAYYNNYQTNRAGFSKLFKQLSDHAWEKSIELIQHINKRGGVMDFARRSTQEPTTKANFTVELHELESLAKALDTQKELADRAFHIHREATRNSQHLHDAEALDTQKELADRAFHIHREATRNSQHLHDAEIAQYLEEEFIEYQAKTIRDLAGHTSDLKKFVTGNNGNDLSLSLYLFDEYLQKAV